MSYNAVILVQILDQYLHLPISDHAKSQIQSVLAKASSLVHLLDDKYSPANNNQLLHVETRIRDVAYSAEDIVEWHICDQTASSEVDLTNVVEELDSIRKELLRIQTEWLPDTIIPAASVLSPEPRHDLEIIVGRDRHQDLEARLVAGPLKLQVIPIVGMKGMGKTFLARCCYNLLYSTGHFENCAWVVVSEVENDLRSNLLDVLWGLGKHDYKMLGYDLDRLGSHVQNALRYKKYLIVVDGVWDIEDWKKLAKFFPDDNFGSRILFTTRNIELATYVNLPGLYRISPLTPRESISLLTKKVFGEVNFPPDEFRPIAKRIAFKCMGSPLALTLLAGILSTSRMTEFWEAIEEDMISGDSVEDLHMHIMSMCYNYLPYHLKPCFLYMATFARDREILTSTITRLWIAEGFVKPTGDTSLDDIAKSYLKSLMGRNLIALYGTKRGRMKYAMHRGLLDEFCQKKASEQKFLWSRTLHQHNLERDDEQAMRRVRLHLSPESANETDLMLHTRTFVGHGCASLNLPHMYLWLRYLRVLHVLRLDLYRFPREILQLMLLRYLAIRCRSNLPSDISRLENLQFLIIFRPSFRAISLPSQLWKMTQLRLVKCTNNCVWYYPQNGERVLLEKLEALSNVQLLGVTNEFLAAVPNLKKLGIFGNVTMHTVLDLARLHKLEKLKCSSDWSLASRGYLSFLTFPHSLRHLTVTMCRIPWGFMNAIGSLPGLEQLNVYRSDFSGFECEASEPEWELTEGEFPSLLFLHMEDLNLVHWNANSTHFPRLQRLYFRRCCTMLGISSDIGNIPTIQMIRMDKTNPSLMASAMRIREEQKHAGNKLLHVYITAT